MSIKFTILILTVTIILQRKIFRPSGDGSYFEQLAGNHSLFPKLMEPMFQYFAYSFRF